MLVNLDTAEIAYLTATLEDRRDLLRMKLQNSIDVGRPDPEVAAELRRIVGVLVQLRHGLRRH